MNVFWQEAFRSLACLVLTMEGTFTEWIAQLPKVLLVVASQNVKAGVANWVSNLR